jgi:hypothetical protein
MIINKVLILFVNIKTLKVIIIFKKKVYTYITYIVLFVCNFNGFGQHL